MIKNVTEQHGRPGAIIGQKSERRVKVFIKCWLKFCIMRYYLCIWLYLIVYLHTDNKDILFYKEMNKKSLWDKNSGFSLLQTLCFKNFFLLVARYDVKHEDIFYVKVSIVPPETGDTTLKDARFHGLICWKYFRFSAWIVVSTLPSHW